MPRQNQRNNRGRGAYRRGGFNNSQRAAQGNINITVPQVLTAEQIANIVRTELHPEKAASNTKPDAVIDVSTKTWDDLDAELDWIEEKLNTRPTYAQEGERKRTIYTDAWDMQPIIDFSIGLFKASGVGSTLSKIHNTDIVGFIGYMCALTETYLLSNQELIGVNNITRDQVTAAHAFIQQQTIPEMMALMLLQMRPTQLPDGTRIVLIPHTFDRNNAAQAHQITWTNAEDLDIALHQYVAIPRPVGGALGNAVNLTMANLRATNWMKVLSDVAEGSHDVEYYARADLNPISPGTQAFTEMYTVCARTEGLFDHANPVLFDTHVWDVWFNYDVRSYVSANMSRKYLGFGNQSCYATLSKMEIPFTIMQANGDILRESRSAKERWVPWIVTDTVANAQAFVAEIRAMVASCVVNYTRSMDRSLVQAPARALRCYYLALGHGDAMVKDYLA